MGARIYASDERVVYLIDRHLDAPNDPKNTLIKLTADINATFPHHKPIGRAAVTNWVKNQVTKRRQQGFCQLPTLPAFHASVPSRSIDINVPVDNYSYGYTDHGEKTLLFYDWMATRVKVLHLSKDKEDVSYYKCAHCDTGRATLRASHLEVRQCSSSCDGRCAQEFHAEQCVRLAKYHIRNGMNMRDAHAIAQDQAISRGCYEGMFRPYWTLSNDYSRLQSTQMAEEPTTLKTGERWLLHKSDTHSVYASDRMLEALATCEIALVDGTFSKSPRGYYQVLTISGLLKSSGSTHEEYQPLVTALVRDKTVATYLEVVDIIKEAWKSRGLECKIKRLHCDYESSLQTAMKELVGEDKVYGCLFHYSQALLRFVVSLGLYRYYKSEDGAYKKIREWIRALLALPCLPKAERQYMWDNILKDPPTKPDDFTGKWPESDLADLAKYMEEHWLILLDNTWVFFGLGRTRNTNAMEAFHRVLPCNERKPRLSKFLYYNRIFFTDVDNQVLRLQNGCATKRRSKKYVQLQENVLQAETWLQTNLHVIQQSKGDDEKRIAILYRFCRRMSHLLHDIRNKSCNTVKSGKTATVKKRLPTLPKANKPVDLKTRAYEIMAAISDEMPEAAEPQIIYTAGDIVPEDLDLADVDLAYEDSTTDDEDDDEDVDDTTDDGDATDDGVEESCKIDDKENQPPFLVSEQPTSPAKPPSFSKSKRFNPYTKKSKRQSISKSANLPLSLEPVMMMPPEASEFLIELPSQTPSVAPATTIPMQLHQWPTFTVSPELPSYWPSQVTTLHGYHQPPALATYEVAISPLPTSRNIMYTSPKSEELLPLCDKLNVQYGSSPHESVVKMSLRKARKIVVADVPADGHCGYSSVSVLLTGSIHNRMAVRKAVSEAIITQQWKDTKFPDAYDGFCVAAPTDEARREALIDKANKKFNPPNPLNPEAWWETQESMALSLMLNVNVVVYVESQRIWTLWNETSLKGISAAKLIKGPTILLYLSNNHYTPIISVE